MGETAEEILERALAWGRSRAIAERARGPGETRVFTSDALAPLLAAVMFRAVGDPLVVAVARDAAALAADIECFIPGEAFHLPPAGPGGDWLRPCDEVAGQRLKAARALSQGKVVVVGIEALVEGMPEMFVGPWPLALEVGEEFDRESMLRLLVDGGYQREYTVDGWGRFAVRGGILDIFPSTSERPVRVELLGDRIESIREFNVVSQRSGNLIDDVEIFPATGGVSSPGLSGDNRSTLERRGSRGHLVPLSINTVTYRERRCAVPANGAATESYSVSTARKRNAAGADAAAFECERIYGMGHLVLAVNPDVLEARAREFMSKAGLEPPDEPVLSRWGTIVAAETFGAPEAGELEFPGAAAREFRGDLTAAVRNWNDLMSSGNDVFLLLDGKAQVERIHELWLESSGGKGAPRAGVGALQRGFSIPELKLSLFTSSDLLGAREKQRRPRRVSSGTPVVSYAELEVNGYAVHMDQGIGIYRGLVSREVMGVTREYLFLEYAGGDKLYVPTTQLGKVQRYVGGENPKVHRLRARDWARSRAAARRSASKTARGLLQLYMERKSARGFAFSPDEPWQRELEDGFPYEDTPDQARAVVEVKADMESESVMDRLICGDVGYGKTEVAVRAAMKSVLDSRQVALLAPTTILARQHYETFRERFDPFGVKVEMLSRFLSRKEQESIARQARHGEIDILIGTHRMLQKDVAFKTLGLFIVDEEQKFGVAHKERLRRRYRDVDTLTLTATPIPRTLQMSLSGIRDISIIDTPPEDRRPVVTYVGEFDMKLVRRAVNYEIARGGQVFYVHNRIASIRHVAETLRHAFPEMSIAIGHGQMDEDELERVMLEFADGAHEVLVCTTIIESGLDLPNVNTLIVDRADLLGLAQMYQIRGRVGRSRVRAYAYMFYPRRDTLSDTAVARLATINEMTPLGSGMRVAQRDLEIRGAGSLLGAEQSGQIEAVGFELYCELLKEAVEILKGETPEATIPEAVVELPVDAYIPDDYIADQEIRVEEYRRLIVAGKSGTIDEFAIEIEDRFGEAPVPVKQLLEVERLKRNAARAGIVSITMKKNELKLEFDEEEERAMTMAASFAQREGIVGEGCVYTDSESWTIYLKLRFEEAHKRQELLLKWLKSTIDDIIMTGETISGAQR